ncbi:glycoside hydrolase family 99-like domain-containing protein [Halomontanus rarus]|uniref:glycoside hydrolase family 99-like domain-containing protein n=2 Tax=Halomontanus rarus TaxID=3034020 RepID=UPI00293C061A|nr:glycoside hydrolase family 99-like domain-containing protein [Halovivax sp. KZCA124]
MSTNDTPSGELPDGADLIGAHYCTWLYPENYSNDSWADECVMDPVLGNYDGTDSEVIQQHIDWSLDHGLNWWWMSWWGRDEGPENTNSSDKMIRSFLETEGADRMPFSILYESTGLLEWTDDGTVDLDDPENRSRLRDHFEYFAENFFDQPNYRRIDGKPAVFMYVSRTYTGDIEAALSEAKEAAGEDLYLIGDFVDWEPPSDDDREAIRHYDAITTYNSYKPREDIDEIDFVDRVVSGFEEWQAAADEQNVAFIPEVIPGFDDTEITHVPDRPAHPVLSRDEDRFVDMCERALEYRDETLNAVFLTSFNEWFENSVVEPSESEGTKYLEILRDVLSNE